MHPSFYLGVDVSKGYADFCILDHTKHVVEETFQLDDTAEGHHQLYSVLHRYAQASLPSTVYAAAESTGGYENNWLAALQKFSDSHLKVCVARLNPIGVNHNTKAGLKRIITDKESARNIAEYLLSHPEKVNYTVSACMTPQRKLWTYIQMLNKQKTQLLNQLERLLYIANPELLMYCRQSVPQWILKLICHYPSAALLAKASVEKLCAIPYLPKKQALTLIEHAAHSAASADDELTSTIIKSLAQQILSLQHLLDEQLKLLEHHLVEQKETLHLLMSFKGIGTYSAMGIVTQIGDFNNFASAKKVASFAGIHPVFKDSGDGSSVPKMSKQGRSALRQILFNVARSAIVHNPLIKEIYQNHLANGKKKMAALGIVMHKILRIIFGMVTHNTPFDPEIDKRNRTTTVNGKQSQRKTTSHRLLPVDWKAPVSNRQWKKRKEQEPSQNDQSQGDK